ncbi:MAG: hypothetical protein J0L99_18900 [Chitinophagales bacterium]|nr:hypothetical protein [Chitinophagales bacterium]
MKNYLNGTIGLTVLLLAALLSLSWLPKGLKFAHFELKEMDLLADVRRTSSDAAADPAAAEADSTWMPVMPEDTLAIQDTLPAVFEPLPAKDSSWYGRRIEDYTPAQEGLQRFFAAIDSTRKGRTVRIAFYGDSFVEGDILIGDLRDSLQSLWGGRGVGFVPMTSEVSKFKRTFRHDFRGWATHSIIKKEEGRPLLGLNGYTYTPAPEAKVHYEGLNYFKNTGTWSQVRLFYSASSPTPMVWQQQGGAPQSATLKTSGSGVLGSWLWTDAAGTSAFAIRFPDPGNLQVYGATLESGPGIYIDNFSVRGNSGGPLKLLKPEFIQQFDAVQRYDLVVIQVGLNAVTNSLNNIKWYRAELDRTFAHLKNCFPGKPILVVSVGDRGTRINGEIVTMRGVPAIVAMQRELAREHGLLFFDLYHGMGGAGSMWRLSNHKPMLANKDYTHLTHEGGRHVSHLFVDVLLSEKARVDY